MSIANVLDRAVGVFRRLVARPHAFDDASEIAVADDLAVLAEGDDGAIDRLDFRGRDLQGERIAAPLDRMAARVAADDELFRLLADILRPHDLVRARVLEDAVLMDAG